MRVTVCYAPAGAPADLRDCELPEASTVADALRASGLLERHPEIDLGQHRVGIFGRLESLETALRPGDRVEVYRPLAIDPKLARRRRSARR